MSKLFEIEIWLDCSISTFNMWTSFFWMYILHKVTSPLIIPFYMKFSKILCHNFRKKSLNPIVGPSFTVVVHLCTNQVSAQNTWMSHKTPHVSLTPSQFQKKLMHQFQENFQAIQDPQTQIHKTNDWRSKKLKWWYVNIKVIASWNYVAFMRCT